MGSWGFVLWLVGLSAITFFAIAWLLDISNRQRQLQEQLDQTSTDPKGGDQSEQLKALAARLDGSEAHMQELRTELDRLARFLPQCIQAVGLVRFQAFSDFGGDQSFALALTNEEGDGAILSGIFAREGTRVYAKPLATWTSSYSLSFEEEQAISQAQSQVSTGA